MTSRKPPSQRDPQYALQRINRALTSMAPGTMGGRVANASPISGGASSGESGGGGVAEANFSFYGLLHETVSPPYRVLSDAISSLSSVTVTLGSAGVTHTVVDLLLNGIVVATVTVAAGSTHDTDTVTVDLARDDVLNARVTEPGDGAIDVTVQVEF